MRASTILENEVLRIAVSNENGNIESVYFKDISEDLIKEPRLAANFQINLQSEAQEANYIFGKCQKLTSIEKGENSLILFWKGPLTNELGEHDLDVSMTITLDDDQISFQVSAENRTECDFSEVWAPIIGGINGLGERKDTKAMIPLNGEGTGEDLFTHFHAPMELGLPIPEVSYSYPGEMGVQWLDFYNEKINRGVYFACYDVVPRFKSIRFELEPGAAHFREDNWPRHEDFDKDLPIGMNMNWVFFPYTKKGDTFVSPPLVIKYHEGNWENVPEFYEKWFRENFKIVNPDRWQRAETSFLCTMFMLPESNILFTYKDIPRWVDSAKKYGVNAVLACGWDYGGHDKGYPYYDIEPRLGTEEELRAGIEYAHSVGVKFFFFVNFHQMDTSTDIYKEEFQDYRISDPFGNQYQMGFGMGTFAARKNWTSPKMLSINPSYKPMRDYIVEKMKWLVEIGADGVHVDKIGFSNLTAIDLNPKIRAMGYAPDTSIWKGILEFCKELDEACKAINPDFCFSIEGSWDRFLEYTDVNWMWTNPWAADHTCTIKYTLPEWTPCYCIDQPCDYTTVNEGIRNGYQLFISPMMITAGMDHPKFTKLSAYIQEVEKIRAQVKDVIYYGRFMKKSDTAAWVSSENHVKNKCFINEKTGRKGCVFTNTDSQAQEASIDFLSGSSEFTVYKNCRSSPELTLF
jgi:hypothetical protein